MPSALRKQTLNTHTLEKKQRRREIGLDAVENLNKIQRAQKSLCKSSQQLPVENTDDSGALQAVGGSAALALLEGVWQFLNIIPGTEILQGEIECLMHPEPKSM